MLKLTETLLTNTFYYLLLIVSSFSICVFAGALYYIRKYPMELSFSDIGAMLAGIGTIGLLFVAWRTSKTWVENLNEVDRRNFLEQWFRASLEFHFYLKYTIATKYKAAVIYRSNDELSEKLGENANKIFFHKKRRELRASLLEISQKKEALMVDEKILEIHLKGYKCLVNFKSSEPFIDEINSSIENDINDINKQKSISKIEE